MSESVLSVLCLFALGVVLYLFGKARQQKQDAERDLRNLSGVVKNAKNDHAKIDDMHHDDVVDFLRSKKP